MTKLVERKCKQCGCGYVVFNVEIDRYCEKCRETIERYGSDIFILSAKIERLIEQLGVTPEEIQSWATILGATKRKPRSARDMYKRLGKK